MRGGNLEALEVPARKEVGHAAHRIRPVNGGSAVTQDLNVPYGDRWQGRIDIHRLPAGKSVKGRIGDRSFPVDQNQRVLCPQAAKIDGRAPISRISGIPVVGALVAEIELVRVRGNHGLQEFAHAVGGMIEEFLRTHYLHRRDR